MGPVGGIDVDENEPGERGAELRQHPFADIGRPDADPIALFEAELAQAHGQVFGPAQEVGVAPAHVLVAGDLREALRPFGRDAAQKLTDRLADQRRRRHAVDVGLGEQRHLKFRSLCSPHRDELMRQSRTMARNDAAVLGRLLYHNSRKYAAGFWLKVRQAPIMPSPTVTARPPAAAASAAGQSKTKSNCMMRSTTQ